MSERVCKFMLVKRLIVGFLLIALVIVLGSSTMSYGQTTLSVQARNVSDNSPATGIEFGQLTPDTKFATPDQYIEIDYESDQSLWFIDIYTDNTNWSGGGYQRGGLITGNGKQRAPLLWRVYADVQMGGVPFNTTADWAWLKDKGDRNDPSTTQYDESWAKALNDGYVNICYGGPGYTNLAPYPNDPPDLRPGSSPMYVYLGGLFESAGAGEYSTVILFDLYHLAPEDKPVISHKPIERIGIIGNKIVFNAKITDDKSVRTATIHYKIGKSGSWQSWSMVLKGSPVEKIATYVLPPQAVTGPCEIFYWLEARDGEGNSGYWKDESSPQVIKVSQSVTEMVWFKGGKVVLPDGNPDDGEVMVDIPEGAVNRTTKITVEQITDLSGIPDYTEGGDWKPIAIYNFTDEEGMSFDKAVAINLLYFDLDNNGKPENWSGDDIDFSESQLACYWWDGFTWRPVGGEIDRDKNIVAVKVSHFSYYALFEARPMGISEYRPKERIISPASPDGKNDVAYFSGLSGQATTIRIYDITGKKVRTIDREPYEWDGRDEDGDIVETGVYIYQFEANVDGKRKLVSGTMAVAK